MLLRIAACAVCRTDLHIADGKVNFALYTAYQMLTYLLISGRMGEAVSASTLWLMRGITRKNAAIALPEDTGSGGFEVPEGFDERYMDRLESALAKFKARFDAEVTRLEGETARIEDVTDDDLPVPGAVVIQTPGQPEDHVWRVTDDRYWTGHGLLRTAKLVLCVPILLFRLK